MGHCVLALEVYSQDLWIQNSMGTFERSRVVLIFVYVGLARDLGSHKFVGYQSYSKPVIFRLFFL